MNYIGSKLSLLNFLENSIHNTLKSNNDVRSSSEMIFADLFAGTGIVGSTFKTKGYNIISNDIQHYSYVLNKHLIENYSDFDFNGLSNIISNLKNLNPSDKITAVFEYLNNLKASEGFIYKNYCLGGTKNSDYKRMYFTDENGLACDTIRSTLENWYSMKYINQKEYYFILASLINSIDKYANTASVYGAFLKKYKYSAQKKAIIEPLPLHKNEGKHFVYNDDVNSLITNISGDILYLDPPYNARQYSSNYHLLETISKYDNPIIKGKTGLRDYSNQKSLYCSSRTVTQTFEDLIKKANFKYIFLSYNNEGLMSSETVKEIMEKYGTYKLYTQNYKRFRADKEKNRNHKNNVTTEYLHVLIKDI